MIECSESLRLEGKPYPRTCAVCGLGPCRKLASRLPAETATQMALVKFLSWFCGYVENIDTVPTPEQWGRIKGQVMALERYAVEHAGAGGPFRVSEPIERRLDPERTAP